jgi:membrane protease subunit HflK
LVEIHIIVWSLHVAWNQPGGAGDKDPWGKQRKPEQGFDIERALRDLWSRVRAFLGIREDNKAGGGAFGIGLVLGAVLAVWLAFGVYVVQEGERGVVIRFGQKIDIREAGLHWHWPYPIGRVEKVNVEAVSSMPIGYRVSVRGGDHSKMPREALMLTQDENLIDVEFAVKYRVADPEAYLFNVADAQATIAQAAEAAMRETVAGRTLDALFTEQGRSEVARAAQERLLRTLEPYRTGVAIVAVDKPRVQPPDEVRSAFDEVAKAGKEAQGLKSEAEAYAADILPRARTTATRKVQEAETYKASVITRAEGDARRFTQIAQEYLKAPAVTRERLYIEMMEQVLSNTTKVFVSGNNTVQLSIDRPAPAVNDTEPVPAEGGVIAPRDTPSPRARGDQRSRRVSP